MHFSDRLVSAIQDRKTPLCVGLDPRQDRLPRHWQEEFEANPGAAVPSNVADIYRRFCEGIIDVVAPLVPCVKPQAAFFEALGPAGMAALADVVQYAQNRELLVIMDAKRGDIGSTANAYANAYLLRGPQGIWRCDSLTVNPYLGDDSLEPFVNVACDNDGGVFVLVKTSNPGGKLFQELEAEGKPVFRHVAQHVQSLAAQTQGECRYGAVGAVVGATYPQQLTELRQEMPNTLFLVPGLGAQGGTAKDINGGFDECGLGAVINSSRAIIFAYEQDEYANHVNWQGAVEQATRDTIQQLAENTRAGQLRST